MFHWDFYFNFFGLRIYRLSLTTYLHIFPRHHAQFGLRPWIPRLYVKMDAALRAKLSSEGVTVKKVDPKTGKKTVSVSQLKCQAWL